MITLFMPECDITDAAYLANPSTLRELRMWKLAVEFLPLATTSGAYVSGLLPLQASHASARGAFTSAPSLPFKQVLHPLQTALPQEAINRMMRRRLHLDRAR